MNIDEDTCGWLGIPTPLEMHKQHSRLANSIRQFQFKDIRPKVASEIELIHASRLLGHSTEEMTKKVYRRVGEIVKPTK